MLAQNLISQFLLKICRSIFITQFTNTTSIQTLSTIA